MPAEDGLRLLILGGTAEANALAKRVHSALQPGRLVLSLAGRTREPDRPAGIEVRIGGFGGAAAMAAWLVAEGITHLVDATHPFAPGISRNAAEAAESAGVKRLALHRPAWDAQPGDRWTRVACLKFACDALPPRARPFLALGRQHIAPFRHRPDLKPVLRTVDAPSDLPFAAHVVVGKPGDLASEIALFERMGVTHLVCRNAGGAASYAKIAAARALELPVVLIERPTAPLPPVVDGVEAAIGWLAG